MQLGFIGTGEITSAIVTGLCSSSDTHSIWVSPRNASKAKALADRFAGVSVASSNQEVLDRSAAIVIAVRPPLARGVLAELRFRPEHKVVSLVSALSMRSLTELAAPATQIARAVPLPSAAKRLSPTAIYPSDPTATEIFSAVGTVFPVEKESDFETFCATTATLASYFAFNNAIASWLERQGIPAAQAREYIGRLFGGEAAVAVEEPEQSFHALAASHTTPGGINEQFLKHLVEHGLMTSVPEALDAILRRITGAA